MLLFGTQQAHLRASSTSAVVVYSVFHVSYWGPRRHVCNHPDAVSIGVILTFVRWLCVCVYHMNLSHVAIGTSGWVAQTPKWLVEHHFLCWRWVASWAFLADPGLAPAVNFSWMFS